MIGVLEAKPVILYVEDDDLVAYLVHNEITGFDIVRVWNGNDALAFLNRTGIYHDAPTPALVLLDLHMPKMDGFETLAKIKANSSLASIPVVIFTTSQWQEDREKALRLGAHYFLQKPTALEGFSEVAAILKKIVEPS